MNKFLVLIIMIISSFAFFQIPWIMGYFIDGVNRFMVLLPINITLSIVVPLIFFLSDEIKENKKEAQEDDNL